MATSPVDPENHDEFHERTTSDPLQQDTEIGRRKKTLTRMTSLPVTGLNPETDTQGQGQSVSFQGHIVRGQEVKQGSTIEDASGMLKPKE